MAKIAIIGDPHLGYARFEEDAYIQAKAALEDAEKRADIIILAGDIFDTKIPRMEVLERAISLLKNIKKPIIAIHGNHERRSKDLINALQLLNSSKIITYLHNESKLIEIEGEKINIVGLGSIPSAYVKEGVEKTLEKNPVKEGIMNILVLHQNISELSIGEEELTIQDIEELPFDLVINGHIHKQHIRKKLIVPGSTVVTQLKEEEQAPRSYILYDTKERNVESIEIPHRKFEIIKIEFKDAGIAEIKEMIEETLRDIPEEQITKLVLNGNAKEGINARDIFIPKGKNLFVENKLNAKSLKEKIEQIKKSKDEKLSVREFAVKRIEDKTKGKVSFEPSELFSKLVQGVEETEKYLEGKND